MLQFVSKYITKDQTTLLISSGLYFFENVLFTR